MGVVRSAAAGVSLAGVSAGAGHEARGTARPSRDAADEGVQNPVTISAAAEAMTAMFSGTVPSVSFGDPLGSPDPLNIGDRGPADLPAMPQDLDVSFPNGSEAAS